MWEHQYQTLSRDADVARAKRKLTGEYLTLLRQVQEQAGMIEDNHPAMVSAKECLASYAAELAAIDAELERREREQGGDR
ncbi:MAG: hypothetical protein OXC11_08655 [Rhodospirillales bacterium]|nr:hypothetical protein [Rhodospirillales bacterium]